MNLPRPVSPKTVGPSALKTSDELSGLASPRSVSPVPAKATVATLTMAYVSSSRRVEMTAARPGVFSGLDVSSLMLTAVSQPQ